MRRSPLLALPAALMFALAAVAVGATPHHTTVSTRHTSLGTILVGPGGRTLYMFSADHNGHSACSGACAAVWPPLLTVGAPVARGGAKGANLGTIKHGSAMQVTYKGHPLYTYISDTGAGQTTGEGSNSFGSPWYVLSGAGKAITHGTRTSSSKSSSTSSTSSGW